MSLNTEMKKTHRDQGNNSLNQIRLQNVHSTSVCMFVYVFVSLLDSLIYWHGTEDSHQQKIGVYNCEVKGSHIPTAA